MVRSICKRMLAMIIILAVISIISFVVIQLPPGDYVTTYIISLKAQFPDMDPAFEQQLRDKYGVDQPVLMQYFKWITRFLHGDMGHSFEYNQEVSVLISERIGLTICISLAGLLFTWALAMPLGVYSATHKYKFSDYLLSILGFIGMAIPNFFMGLVILYFSYKCLGWSAGGLFSREFANAPWSIAKFGDMLKHLLPPIIVLGTGGTAGMIRTMRSNTMDELKQPYVKAARGRGLKERTLIWRYPVRVALNPFLSTLGWTLPGLISGGGITAIVLNLPTTGPLLLSALKCQDMYLAASILMVLSILTVVGTLISDVILAVVEPRIRFGDA